jgi:hypothetical protein
VTEVIVRVRNYLESALPLKAAMPDTNVEITDFTQPHPAPWLIAAKIALFRWPGMKQA